MAKTLPNYTSRTHWNGTIKMSLSKFFVLYVLHDRPMPRSRDGHPVTGRRGGLSGAL